MKWERKRLNETYTVSHTIIINETFVGMATKSKWILLPPSIREAGLKNINGYSFVLISLPSQRNRFLYKQSPRFFRKFLPVKSLKIAHQVINSPGENND